MYLLKAMKKVLIIEDDPGIRDSMQLMFAAPDYDVTVFASADPVLENLYELPDIFIIDRLLSGVDGLDLCKHLKSQSSTSKIPVIILSASPNIPRLAQLAGADAGIEKPFRVSKLMETVENCLSRK